MLHLSYENIVHKDLAARNVLISAHFEAKVADFGLSKKVGNGKERQTLNFYEKSAVGPIKWMAPESLSKFQFSTKSDVYSFGVVMVEVLTRKEPYPSVNTNKYLDLLKNGTKLNLLEGMQPSLLTDLIKQCIQDDPGKRPSFEAICKNLANLQ